MSTFNYFNDVQAYEALETKRTKVMLDPQYQQWVKELHISQSYVEPEGAIRAAHLNSQYDYSNLSPKSSFLNFLKLKGIWS
jgi:hypothetical protein